MNRVGQAGQAVAAGDEDVLDASIVRCPMLRVSPTQRPRLSEIISNLGDRITEAQLNGWLGEVTGLQASLNEAARKSTSLDRAARSPAGAVNLGLPIIAARLNEHLRHVRARRS